MTDYYPFGSVLRQYKLNNTEEYRFGYQGQFAEEDDETGWNSFELRNYDAVVGRWTSTDPAGQFASPYLGMGNNPVSGVDPDGGYSLLGALWRSAYYRGSKPYQVDGEWGYNAPSGRYEDVNGYRVPVIETYIGTPGIRIGDYRVDYGFEWDFYLNTSIGFQSIKDRGPVGGTWKLNSQRLIEARKGGLISLTSPEFETHATGFIEGQHIDLAARIEGKFLDLKAGKTLKLDPNSNEYKDYETYIGLGTTLTELKVIHNSVHNNVTIKRGVQEEIGWSLGVGGLQAGLEVGFNIQDFLKIRKIK